MEQGWVVGLGDQLGSDVVLEGAVLAVEVGPRVGHKVKRQQPPHLRRVGICDDVPATELLLLCR